MRTGLFALLVASTIASLARSEIGRMQAFRAADELDWLHQVADRLLNHLPVAHRESRFEAEQRVPFVQGMTDDPVKAHGHAPG